MKSFKSISKSQFLLACQRLLLSGWHSFWRLFKSTPGWSCCRWSFEADPVGSLECFLTQVSAGSTTLSQRPNTCPCSGNNHPCPKKAKVVSSARKVIWDAKSIVFFDYLQESQTINGEHYANLLRQIWKAIKSRRPRKIRGPVSRGQCSCTQVCVCNGCCAWPWLWTSWSFSIFSWFGTFWLFSVSQHEKNNYWLGSTFGLSDDEVISLLRTFLNIFMTASIPQESKRRNTDGRNVWTKGETIFKNKPNLFKFSHCIMISLWTFQPTESKIKEVLRKWIDQVVSF